MMPEYEYELLTQDRKTVRWPGTNAEDAARRYVDCHREQTVIATRPVVHGLFVGAPRG